jgi:hypothetical protein
MSHEFFNIISSHFTSTLHPPAGFKAYLDPGSGSYLLQLLIAGLLGSFFVIRAYWEKITGFFARRSNQEEEPKKDQDVNADGG